jgi:NDP-sugar pyrophosphorylase family protein
MDVKGIILAGGKATRLPNKPILPIRHNMLAVESSINLYHRSGIHDIYIVVPPNHVLPQILSHRHGYTFKYVYQPRPDGVPGAIMAVLAQFPSITSFFVSCCDNVYHDEEFIDVHNIEIQKTTVPLIVTRNCSPADMHRLSGWDEASQQWQHPATNVQCFAGWTYYPSASAFTQAYAQLQDSGSCIELINALKAKPFHLDQTWWYDIGTVQAYREYWSQG